MMGKLLILWSARGVGVCQLVGLYVLYSKCTYCTKKLPHFADSYI